MNKNHTNLKKQHPIIRIILFTIIIGSIFAIQLTQSTNNKANQPTKSVLNADLTKQEINYENTPRSSAIEYNRSFRYGEDQLYGAQVIMPTYFQINGSSPWSKFPIYLYNSFLENTEAVFRNFNLSVDGTQEVFINNPYNSDQSWNVESPYLQTPGVHELKVEVGNILRKEKIIKTAILNVTNKTSIFPYYDDSNMIKLGSSEKYHLNWNVQIPSGGNYDYRFYLNETLLSSGYSYNNILSLELNDSNGFTSVGEKNMKLIVNDTISGYSTSNEFTITVINPNQPSVNEISVLSREEVFLWDSNVSNLISFKAHDMDGDQFSDLDRAEVYITIPEANYGGNIRIHHYCTIKNLQDEQITYIPFKQKMIDTFIRSNPDIYNIEPDGSYWGNLVNFKIIAVDKGEIWNKQQLLYEELDHIGQSFSKRRIHEDVIERNLPVRGGNINITNFEVSDSDDTTQYSMTVVADARETTNLNIRAISGENIEDFHHGCEYDRLWGTEYENQKVNSEEDYDCSVFYSKSVSGDDVPMGILFWINPEDAQKIQFPVIVKISYPSAMEPDENLDEKPLKLLYWDSTYRQTYETQEWGTFHIMGKWEILEDAVIKPAGTYQKEIEIQSPGLYAFGMDNLDYIEYQGNKGIGVPGFPIEIFLGISSLAMIYIVRKYSNKVQKR